MVHRGRGSYILDLSAEELIFILIGAFPNFSARIVLMLFSFGHNSLHRRKRYFRVDW